MREPDTDTVVFCCLLFQSRRERSAAPNSTGIAHSAVLGCQGEAQRAGIAGVLAVTYLLLCVCGALE